MNTIGDRIRLLRNEYARRSGQRCSQKAFGKRIGIGQAAQSALEKGIRNVTNRNVDLICQEFNVNENWLRTGDGPIFQELSRDEEIADFVAKILRPDYTNDFVKNFINILARLNEAEWKLLEKMLQSLTSIKAE